MTPTGWDAKFQALEQCPEANSEAISQAVQTIVQGRPDEDAVKETQFEADGNLAACKIENTKDGFMLMSRDQSSSRYTTHLRYNGLVQSKWANPSLFS